MPTLSIIKADAGGFVGYRAVHPDMVAVASRAIDRAPGELLIEGQVATCGDDLASHS
jgi:fructose 1,6-bisphosphate aldolase/phosphatase